MLFNKLRDDDFVIMLKRRIYDACCPVVKNSVIFSSKEKNENMKNKNTKN